jgi:hypothetical protein
MSYLTQDAIASNTAMQHRVAQCYAQERGSGPSGMDDPDRWSYTNRRSWASSPGWDAAWESALAGDADADPGENPACITDAQILSQVQSMLS